MRKLTYHELQERFHKQDFTSREYQYIKSLANRMNDDDIYTVDNFVVDHISHNYATFQDMMIAVIPDLTRIIGIPETRTDHGMYIFKRTKGYETDMDHWIYVNGEGYPIGYICDKYPEFLSIVRNNLVD